MNRWVVEIQPSCWLAPWTGDPGRTCLISNAKLFNTRPAAEKALQRAREYSPFTKAETYPVRVIIKKI